MFLLPVIDYDETQNRHWNASLDGRSIHSFLLWIEPHSNAWSRRTAAEHQGTSDGSPHALARALTGLTACAAITVDSGDVPPALLPLANGPTIAVFGTEPGGTTRLRPAGPAVRTAVTEALRVLDGVGLRYVVDLAVGAVVAGAPRPEEAADICDLAWTGSPGTTNADAVAFAETLLREGARSWMGQWLRTEEAVGARPAPLPDTDRAWLTGVLADSFAFQLHDRLATHLPQNAAGAVARRQEVYDRLRGLRDELPDRIGETAGMGIVAELIGITYPCWSRRQFAVKSPFDYIREIRPLTDTEKAEHLRRWAAPTAVR